MRVAAASLGGFGNPAIENCFSRQLGELLGHCESTLYIALCHVRSLLRGLGMYQKGLQSFSRLCYNFASFVLTILELWQITTS